MNCISFFIVFGVFEVYRETNLYGGSVSLVPDYFFKKESYSPAEGAGGHIENGASFNNLRGVFYKVI